VPPCSSDGLNLLRRACLGRHGQPHHLLCAHRGGCGPARRLHRCARQSHCPELVSTAAALPHLSYGDLAAAVSPPEASPPPPASTEGESCGAEFYLTHSLVVGNPNSNVVAALREEPAQGRRLEAPAGGVLLEGRGHRRQAHPNQVSDRSHEILLGFPCSDRLSSCYSNGTITFFLRKKILIFYH
jgi:hypothetical protein